MNPAATPTPNEATVLSRVMLDVGSLPNVRIWRQGVGRARSFDGERVMTFGIPGMADLSGILACGLRVEIECKAARGRLRLDQQRWRDMIRAMGGIWVEARSSDDVLEALKEHWRGCDMCSTRQRWSHERSGDGGNGITGDDG